MKYETFKAAVLNRLSEDIPDPKHITVQQIHRNNGELADGLVILENGVNISPTLYLDHYYRSYTDGTDFPTVYRRLLDSYESNKTDRRIDVRFFTDFEQVRPHIAVKLIHREKNMGLFEKNVPHIPFLDLAIVFYCMFPIDPDIGSATILVDRSHLNLWGITEDELYPIAMENARRYLEPKLRSMGEVLHELTDFTGVPADPVPEDPLYPMYVLSNEQNLFGAACITYDGVLRSFAERFQSGLYILPSSIHEVIIVPSDDNDRMEDFNYMVREVNRTQLSPEDILSDHAYYYSPEEDRIIY